MRIQLEKVNWEEVFNLAFAQNFHAIAFEGAKPLIDKSESSLDAPFVNGPSEFLLMKWYGYSNLQEVNFHKCFSAAKLLAVKFHEQGVRTYVLKGLSLASLYPHPSHRPFGDFDCL